MHVHALRGCTPTPLAHYLKALGILRLVSDQRDGTARGWWKDECFHLATVLDREELLRFFVHEYAPSPITSPWNKGAGFVTENDRALAPFMESRALRFAPLVAGIAAARALVADLAAADAEVRSVKAETKVRGLSKAARAKLRGDPEYKRRLADVEKRFSRQKASLIPRCRLEWRGAQRQWMDAAIVLGDGEKPTFPALLGTGGNDGRLDFTNNLYQRLDELFDTTDGAPRAGVERQFSVALWAGPGLAVNAPVGAGQYLPSGVGGANASNGPTANSAVNPVDFVLMLEGALLFTAHTSRRFDVDARLQASVPFAVRSAATGYASAASSDEGARGEQWMPLWNNPSSLEEVTQLLGEGRARIGGTHAKEPLAFARAVARLGVARGVDGFERFGYIERNGQSNLAVPLGRFRVPDAPPQLLTLLDSVDPWHQRVRRQARDDHAPARLQLAERRLTDSLFAVVEHSSEPRRWQAVLLAMAGVEDVMTTGTGFRAGPVPRLEVGWAAAANDGSVEFRLALAFARQGVSTPDWKWDGVRRHWLPLDGTRFATTGDASSPRLAKRSDVVLNGRDGVADAIALFQRRLIESATSGARHIRLGARPREGAQLSDLALLVSGGVDLDRTVALGRALMALDPRGTVGSHDLRPQAGASSHWPDDAWLALRLALLPWPLDAGGDRDVKSDPAIYRRLAAGDAAGAFAIARTRLEAAGVRCPLRFATVEPARARLWAAALAFPITAATARAIARRLDPNASSGKGIHT
jgi:CRISPR-associated protein Csx17